LAASFISLSLYVCMCVCVCVCVYVSMHVLYAYTSTLVYKQISGEERRVSCARLIAGLFIYFPEECGRC
jgi:hypothetical protein